LKNSLTSASRKQTRVPRRTVSISYYVCVARTFSVFRENDTMENYGGGVGASISVVELRRTRNNG
jgi:hypothetical protein